MDTERTEIIIVDDDPRDISEISALVRRMFPQCAVNEFTNADSAFAAITAETRDKIFLVISDSQMEKSVIKNPKTSTVDGMDVLLTAKQNGIPHAVFYSISASTYSDMLKNDGITCVPKRKFGQPQDLQTVGINALEQYLRSIQ